MFISRIPPVYLPYISRIPPVHLAYISRTSPLHQVDGAIAAAGGAGLITGVSGLYPAPDFPVLNCTNSTRSGLGLGLGLRLGSELGLGLGLG